MNCARQNDTGFYRPRKPWESPLYRLVEDYYEEFERGSPDRYQHKYGFWRPVIRKAVDEYLKCGAVPGGWIGRPPCAVSPGSACGTDNGPMRNSWSKE